MKPRMFVGSSSESLAIAHAIQSNLFRDLEVTVWSQGFFAPSKSTLEGLADEVGTFDFAAFVFASDDVTIIRDSARTTARDNVILEFGLFAGKLGRQRCFVLVPHGAPDLHLPTDLLGITPIYYEPARTDGNMEAATGPASTSLRRRCSELGVRPERMPSAAGKGGDDAAPDSDDEMGPDQLAEHPSWLHGWDLYFRSNFEAAAEAFHAVEPGPDVTEEEAVRWNVLGDFSLFRYSPTEGLAKLRARVAEHPREPVALSYLVDALVLAGNTDEADDCLTKWFQSPEGVPHNPGIASSALGVAKAADDAASTTSLLQKYHSLAPTDPQVRLRLVEQLESVGRVPDAVQLLEKARSGLPYNEELAAKLASLVADSVGAKASLHLYDHLVRRHADSATYLTLRANQLLRLNLNGAAMRDYAAALKLAPKQAWIVANIGNLLNNVGLHHSAVERLREALALDSESLYSHERLASAMGKQSAQDKSTSELTSEGLREYASWKSANLPR